MKYVVKSQQTVKPFTRTRKGKMERVKQFTRESKLSTSSIADTFARREKDPDIQVSSGRNSVDDGYKKWGIKYIDHIIKNNEGKKDLYKKGQLQRAKEIKLGEPYSAGKTFNYNKMKNLIESDQFLKTMWTNRKAGSPNASDEKFAEVMFNTYVVGDSVMEREYNKKGKVVEPFREIGEPYSAGKVKESEAFSVDADGTKWDVVAISKNGKSRFDIYRDGVKQEYGAAKRADIQPIINQLRESQREADEFLKEHKGINMFSLESEDPAWVKKKKPGEPYKVEKYPLFLELEYKPKLKKLGAKRVEDYNIIRQLTSEAGLESKAYFTEKEFDKIAKVASKYGMDIATDIKGLQFTLLGEEEKEEQEQTLLPGSIGEAFSTGEKVKVWKGEHEGKTGEVVSTNGMDVKIKHGEGTITVPKHRLVSIGENMNKSQVKPFTRTRKGKFERVKGFNRIRDMAKYPKATEEAAVHQFAKDHVVTKKKAREYLDEQKQHLKWERTHSGKFGEPISVREQKSVIRRIMSGELPRVDPDRLEDDEPVSMEKKYEKKYSDKDFKVELEIEHPDFADEEYEMGVRSVAVVDYNIDPGSKGGKDEPPYNAMVEDKVVVWAEGPKKGEELTSEEEKKYLSGNYDSLLDDFIMQHAEEQHEAMRDFHYDHLGDPISTYGLASIEQDVEEDETEAVSPEGGTSETKRLSGNEIANVVEAKENINKLVDMSNTIIDDSAVSRMKDELSKLEIHNDWELQDYKDLVEFSEGELKDAKEKGYRSANEYWQAEMPGTITASSSRKIRKGVKLMSIDEVLNLKKSKVQFDFGTEAPEVIEKAVQVKGFTRTRKGRMERVKPHSREQAIRQMKSKEMLHAIASEYNKAKNAEKLYGKDMAEEMRDMHTQDAKDLTSVHKYWLEKDYDGAYNLAADMDTAARDNIPAGVWKDITANTRNLGEPYKTTKARPTKRNKLDADLRRRGLVRGDWDVITQKQNEDGSLTLGIKAIEATPGFVFGKTAGDMIKVRINSSGDILEVLGKPVGEPFLAEHKKISDKWETDLADKLGSMKDKLQSKQPVSNKELNDLIQETENWRQFKIGEPVSTAPSAEEIKQAKKEMSEAKTEDEVKEVINKWGTALYRPEKLGEPVSTLGGAEGYIEAKKTPEGHYKLFFRGTRNEVFPGEKFKSPNEAKQYWRAMKAKETPPIYHREEGTPEGKAFGWGASSIGEPVSTEESKQIASTILMQMGGAGKIKMMTGAKNFMALPSGVSFDFPNKGGPNHVKVTLEPDDTYTVEFGRKAGMKALMSGNLKAEDYYKKISEHTDIYFDQLKELFERNTGLYLSFNKSVTSGEKYVVSLEKSKGPWKRGKSRPLTKKQKKQKRVNAYYDSINNQQANARARALGHPGWVTPLSLEKARTPGAKDKQPRKKKGTGEINRENLVGRISEEHGIHPDDMKDIWKKLQGNIRHFDAEEYGIHPDELPSIKAKLDKLYKSKGGFRMARGGAMGEEEKASAKKEQDETGEKTQAQERLSGYAKRRREEQGPAKNADTDEGGDSEEMAI